MTKNEEINVAIHCLGVYAEQEVCEECPKYGESGVACREVARAAISALKEIQLYKDNKLCLIPEDVYSRQCGELDEYKEIGTVEECREAMEKQRPMMVNEVHVDEYYCPSCGSENCGEQGEVYDKYCPVCGHAIYQTKARKNRWMR